MANLFVGTERISLIELAQLQLDTCRRDKRPKWLSLEAPVGWGKTRIIQEFYHALATRQNEPKYWSDRITPIEASSSSRKMVIPPKPRRGESISPSFIWAGLTCGISNISDDVALAGQLLPLALTLQDIHDSQSSAFRPLRGVALEAGKIAAETYADAVFNNPMLGVTIATLKGIAQLQVGKRQKADRQKAARESAEIDNYISITVQQIAAIATPDCPLILAVEDLHLADAPTALFLSKLTSQNSPVMIISSSLPGCLQTNRFIAPIMEQLDASTLQRVAHDPESSPTSTPVKAFSRLERRDLEELVLAIEPRATRETATKIAARFDNPLCVELFLDIERVRNKFQNGGQPPDSTIESLPNDVLMLYRAHWGDLPVHVRQYLVLASASLPISINPKWGRSDQWEQNLVLDAVLTSFADETIALSSHPQIEWQEIRDWTEKITESLLRFVDPVLRDVAQTDTDILEESDLESFRKSLAIEVHQRWANRDYSTVNDALLGLALNAAGLLQDDLQFCYDTMTLLHALDELPAETERRITLALDALSRVDETLPVAIVVSASLVEAYRETGRFREMYPAAKSVVTAIQAQPDSLLSDWMAATYQVGRALSGLHRSTEALEAFSSIRNHSPQTSEEHREVLKARLAICVEGRRTYSPQTFTELHEIETEFQEIDGVDAPSILVVRHELAAIAALQGDDVRALKILTELVRRESDVLGWTHRETIVSRDSWANAYRQSGNPIRALRVVESALRDANTFLGEDSYDAFQLRSTRGLCLFDLKRYQEAASEIRYSLEGRQLLDPEGQHRNLRVQLAGCLVRAADPEALDLIQRLVGEFGRDVSADVNLTIAAHGWLLEAQLLTGDREAALKTAFSVRHKLSRGLVADVATWNSVAFSLQRIFWSQNFDKSQMPDNFEASRSLGPFNEGRWMGSTSLLRPRLTCGLLAPLYELSVLVPARLRRQSPSR